VLGDRERQIVRDASVARLVQAGDEVPRQKRHTSYPASAAARGARSKRSGTINSSTRE
jgi:hypothetical protein